MNRPKYLIVHHTGGTNADPLADTSHHTFEMVNEYHRQLWNFRSSLGHYIGYHYFIEKNGKVTQGRADYDDGAHCIGKNTTSIGICMAGNFDRPGSLPTKEQTDSLKRILLTLKNTYSIRDADIVPHRKFANKTCYGNNLADDWARRLISSQGGDCKDYEQMTTMELIGVISDVMVEIKSRI